jgi:hypothetical protein
MKFKPGIVLAIFLFALRCFALAGEAPLTLPEYRDQLVQLSAKADSLGDHPYQASQLVTEIPDELAVNTGTRNVTVNFRDLKNDLASFSSAGSSQQSERLQQIKDYLGELQSAVDNLNGAEPPKEREKLNQILSRREFHKVRQPDAREALLAKLFRWLAKWLFRFRISRGNTNNVLQGAVYTLVGIALLVALIWTLRSLRRREEVLPPREIMPFAPSAKNWRTWLAEARQAGELQDWRNAIHLAYWAGISSLESGGAWKPNRARTPREYLRLMGSRNPQYPPLSALTKKFEVVWYGDRVAAEADFRETLTQLEQLGCR